MKRAFDKARIRGGRHGRETTSLRLHDPLGQCDPNIQLLVVCSGLLGSDWPIDLIEAFSEDTPLMSPWTSGPLHYPTFFS